MPKSNFSVFLEILLAKEITETVFKNITWYIVCGTIFKLLLEFIRAGDLFYGTILVALFFPLMLLNLLYGINHIIRPIDDKLGAGIDQLRKINLSDQNSKRVIYRTLSLLLCTKRGFLYFVSFNCYLWIGTKLPDLIAHPFPCSN